MADSAAASAVGASAASACWSSAACCCLTAWCCAEIFVDFPLAVAVPCDQRSGAWAAD